MSSRPLEQESGVVREAPKASGEAECADKPRWTRPEITSFKPVADAQGTSFRPLDGINNLS
jgi:hypothetical protein